MRHLHLVLSNMVKSLLETQGRLNPLEEATSGHKNGFAFKDVVYFSSFSLQKAWGGQRCLSKYLKRHLCPLYFIKGHPLLWIYKRFAPSLLPACGKTATTKQQLYSQVHISVSRHSPSPSALQRGWPFAHRRSWRLYKSPHGICLQGNHPSHSTHMFC